MDEAQTVAFLETMFTHVTEAEAHFDIALTRATVADPAGRAPIDPDWTPTFDEWIAAAEVAELLALHASMTPAQALESFTSEGSTFRFAGHAVADWGTVAASLRTRSVRAAASGMAVIDLGDHPLDHLPRSEAGWVW